MIDSFRQAAMELAPGLQAAWSPGSPTDPLGIGQLRTAVRDKARDIDALAQTLHSMPGYEWLEWAPGDWRHILFAPGLGGAPPAARDVVEQVLLHAALDVAVTHQMFSPGLYADSVVQTARNLEAWKTDQSVEVEVLQVLSLLNVYLPPSARYELPWGVLVAAPHHPVMPEFSFLGNLVISASVRVGSEADPPPEYDLPTAILIRRKSCPLHLGEQTADGAPALFSDTADVLHRLIGAIVLAAGHYRHAAPAFAAEHTSHPFLAHGVNASRARASSGFATIPLPESRAEHLKYYADCLHGEASSSSVLLAVRRLCSALNSTHVEDALVDSVVVWEALFGTPQEATLRVTGSVARSILHQFGDGTSLRDFRSQLGKIYTLRSDVVHGNAGKVAKAANSGELGSSATQAKRYAIRCLREVLLWDAKYRAMSSEERSLCALFDEQWPPPRQRPELWVP